MLCVLQNCSDCDGKRLSLTSKRREGVSDRGHMARHISDPGEWKESWLVTASHRSTEGDPTDECEN